jgi:2-polyprenyl-3-methyl-5-hydroxy-6-metoxy-1,4-benzoquinol methylase
MIGINKDKKGDHEIQHGKKIAQIDPELIWGWKTPAGRLRAKRRAQLIVESAQLKTGITALEIGCGTGVFTEMFAASGAKIIAVDISKELLNLAGEKNLPAEQVQFLERRFEDCDSIGPFDAVIGSSILHHLDIKPAIDKIYRLLKPNGIMSFTEPNMLNPQIAIQKNVSWLKRKMGDSPDETAFMRRPLSRLLKQTGFVGIQITPFDWLHPAIPVQFIDAVARTGLFLEKVPFIREFAGSLHIFCHRA